MSIRFSIIGLTHDHVFSLSDLLLNAGAELVSVFPDDRERFARYQEQFPQVREVDSEEAILDDESIQLVIGLPMPNERAALGIRVMNAGKDFLADKPAFTTLEQVTEARKVHEATGRKILVYFSERLANAASVKAGELVHNGAIGRVIQMMGLGPHRLNAPSRPDWFFERKYSGGILNDLVCHQIDQFLYYTQTTSAEIVTAQVGNYHHPQYAELDDFGDVMLRNEQATAYARVDWFTPEGLGVWGDGRIFLLGTDGYIEIRKICDVQGRAGGNHLFLVNQEKQQYIDCNDVPMPFGEQVVHDVLNRTETAIGQEHCFTVCELSLQAEQMAHRVAG